MFLPVAGSLKLSSERLAFICGTCLEPEYHGIKGKIKEKSK